MTGEEVREEQIRELISEAVSRSRPSPASPFAVLSCHLCPLALCCCPPALLFSCPLSLLPSCPLPFRCTAATPTSCAARRHPIPIGVISASGLHLVLCR